MRFQPSISASINMHKQNKAYIYVASSVLLWSTVASAFKIALAEVTYLQLLFFSSLTSFIALAFAAIIRGKVSLILSQTPAGFMKSAGMALLNPLIYYIILFKAYTILPAQEAQPLNWTWPIVLSVLSVPLLNQKLSRRSLLAIIVSFMGVFIIATRGEITSLKFENPLGVALALTSSIFWAIYWILNVRDKREPLVKLTLIFFFGTVYCGIVVMFFDSFLVSSMRAIISMAYTGVFEMGITFLLWLKALSLARSNASVAVYANITPFLSLVFIHFIVGEEILWSSGVGLLLIIGGILLQSRQ